MRFSTITLVVLLALATFAGCNYLEAESPLTPDERQWVEDHPEGVKVGVGLHYPPYETFDLNGDYQGLSADFIQLISEKTGLKITPVRFRNRQETLKALLTGEVQLMAALEMTPQLRENLDFTQPYISVPAAIICRKEYTEDLTLDKLSGMRIGVTVSDHFTKYLHERYPDGGYSIVPMAGGYIGGLRSLAVGDVDALICDMALASRYIANARISNLRIAGITNYSIELRIASRKDSPMLGNVLRKGLSLILPHERQSTEEEWLSLQYRPFWTSRTFWFSVFAVFGVIMGSIILILFWNRSLKRQVNQRTRTLSSINKVLLGSLDCRTEQEVMFRCLAEAKTMSGSERAALCLVAKGGGMTRILSVSGDDFVEDATVRKMESPNLTSEQIAELEGGRHIRLSIEDEDRHIVAVPIKTGAGTAQPVINVMRSNRDYTENEISLLTEVLFAFDEALQRKRTEISLHDKERQLQRVQRMEALGTLAGGIAHDFNNLLGVIVANGEMIELFHIDGSETLESKTRAILAAAYRGRDLVSQILSFTSRGNEEARLINISPIIKEAVKFLKASLPALINIKYEIGKPEPSILADPTQVHQVIMNLCTNSAHAMEGNGGTLSISLRLAEPPADAVATGTIRACDYLCLSVSDTGKGIPENLHERIFDPFFTTKTLGKGTGLGLAVVQGIVKGWGGFVRMESTVNRGTTFRVYIPSCTDEQFDQPSPIARRKLPGGTGTILFVDDEKELAESYSELLGSLGYKVHSATDSKKALSMFEASPNAFDLVITDYNMPGLRGDKLAKSILAIRPDLPIILCTGYSHSFGEQDAKQIGIETFLNKPVELRNLAMAVSKFLGPGDGLFNNNRNQ
ncbi:ATP-binding protein [Desulfovibrio sp. Fe33]|uniref:ATP-binding protein n=1 Tax=Desulfovibrio sp. Fe33 TaxID=3020842 RepID=UPI00234C656D|nr:transporter substrate-binding domain-containing protein [Desulfovibrio sp. Fe33]